MRRGDRCPFECVHVGGEWRRNGGEEGVLDSVCVCVFACNLGFVCVCESTSERERQRKPKKEKGKHV